MDRQTHTGTYRRSEEMTMAATSQDAHSSVGTHALNEAFRFSLAALDWQCRKPKPFSEVSKMGQTSICLAYANKGSRSHGDLNGVHIKGLPRSSTDKAPLVTGEYTLSPDTTTNDKRSLCSSRHKWRYIQFVATFSTTLHVDRRKSRQHM